MLPMMIRESTGAVPTDAQHINDVKLLLGKYGLKNNQHEYSVSLDEMSWLQI
jgi:hypothetical protein